MPGLVTAIGAPGLEALRRAVIDGGGDLHFSHAFSKGAILMSTENEREGDFFAQEEIDGRVPSVAERMLADGVLAAP